MRAGSEEANASVEFVWLALILLVPIVYVLLGVFEVQRAAFGASAASRSAARAFVLAPDAHVGHQRAQRAARVALADQGVDGATVSIACDPRCHVPGSVVRVTVSTTRGLPFLPELFGSPVASIPVEATHREPFGSFRSEL